MTRYLTILGLVLVAALGLAALSTTDAGAVAEETGPAYFYAKGIGPEETAQIDGEDIGETTAIAFESGELVCSSAAYNGEAGSTGPVSEAPVTIEPEYTGCHALTPLGTKTATVTTNGCVYEIEPTVTVTESEQRHFIGLTDIVCPAGKSIEIHLYNTTNPSDAGASTFCTFDVPAQNNLSGITLTNQAGSPDDIVADFEIKSISVTKTTGFFCGSEKQTAVYEGQATLRATNGASEFVETQQRDDKRFFSTFATPTVLGEKGTAEIQTEKKLLKCTEVKYEAAPGASNIPVLSVIPKYEKCTFGTFTAHVDFKGCEYQFTPIASFHGGNPRTTTAEFTIVCAAGKGPVTVTVTNGGNYTCTVTFAGQKATGNTVKMYNGHNLEPANFADNFINLEHNNSELEYEVKDDAAECGKNEKLKDATLKGKVVIYAYDHAKNTKGIRVVGIYKHK